LALNTYRGLIHHTGVNRVILTQVLGVPLANLFRLQQDYGALTLMTHNGGQWRLLALNIQP
jgi:hypothetical protein